jgi:hypothetical protein
MASNNFIEFNPNKQNIMSDVDYSTESQRLNGVSGIAKSTMHNKLFRQLSVMAAAIGEFIKGTGNDASDSDVATLVTSISKAFATKTSLDLRSTYEVAQGTGTTITLSSAVMTDKFSTTFIAVADNSAAATTVNGKPLYIPGTTNTPTLKAGKAYSIWYDSTNTCFYLRDAENGIVPAILSSGSWSGSTAPYSQEVTVNGVTASNNCIVSVAQGATAAQYEAASEAQLLPYSQAANTITIYAYGDKPAVNIPISVLILG